MAQIAGEGYLTDEDVARIRNDLGLDRPAHTQYFDWLSGVIRGDFGDSLWTGQPVLPQIM